MINISLQAMPSQSLSIQLDGNNYDIRLHSCNNTPQTLGTAIMTVSIARNGDSVVDNVRAVPGFPIIGYPYLENGNFVIITTNDDYPDYNEFGITQFLIFASQSELEAIANGTFIN